VTSIQGIDRNKLNKGIDGDSILAIHDLSAFGHTSLMAAIPIFYTMGLPLHVLPSSILSANTDYPGYTLHDFSADWPGFLDHWKDLGLSFDGLYTGFLGHPGQVEMIREELAQLLQPEARVLVDPVLGDNGKLYSCYDASMVSAMQKLCETASVITPNFTEAALLCGADLRQEPSENQWRTWARQLSLGKLEHVVITSIPSSDPALVEVGYYNRNTDQYKVFDCEYIPSDYSGTGDCFSSFLMAFLMKGYDIQKALPAIMAIIRDLIRLSLKYPQDPRRGLALHLLHQINPSSYLNE